MRAVRFHQYGGPEVLTVEDAPEPHAEAGQIRVRVGATSVNPVDWKIRAGYLHEVWPSSFPAIPGTDAAGVVDEVGDGVTDVQVGDAVFGITKGGGTAEFAILSAWAPVPSGWTTEQAAAAGLASTTAIAGLTAVAAAPGETLLVEGAAGGVGSAVAAIATARGISVIGTASEPHHDYLRQLGATPVTYGDGLAERVAAVAPEGVHAALDLAGSGSLAELISIVGDPARVASAADFNAPALGAGLLAGTSDAQASLAAAAELGADGAYIPHVEATYPLEKAADAHAHVQGGHTQGKVVITV